MIEIKNRGIVLSIYAQVLCVTVLTARWRLALESLFRLPCTGFLSLFLLFSLFSSRSFFSLSSFSLLPPFYIPFSFSLFLAPILEIFLPPREKGGNGIKWEGGRKSVCVGEAVAAPSSVFFHRHRLHEPCVFCELRMNRFMFTRHSRPIVHLSYILLKKIHTGRFNSV